MKDQHLLVAICICTVVAVIKASEEGRESVTVKTADGTFEGHVRRFQALGQDLAVRRFLGVPYAEPPVGELRFQKPVRKAKLDSPYQANEYAPSCKQQVFKLGGKRKPGRFANQKVSEDCLYLNIFTPTNAGSSGELLPVMIYIHGGGFVFGSPKLYAQDVLSAYGNVVAVTIAYRLSIWGFLSTGDQELPGNYGLWDQHMAIQWVHDNIQNFGGDPNSVTVYGSSAGGSSVMFQGMYPGNQGLVHRVIPQSGSVTNVFALNKDILPATVRLGKLVGCSDETTKELADCLKSKSSDELWDVLEKKENNFKAFPWDFIPVVDNDFLPENPSDILHGSSEVSEPYRKAFTDLDLMTGVTAADGYIMLTSLFDVADPDDFTTDRKKFESELVPNVLQIYFGDGFPEVLTQVVINEYTNWENPDDDAEALQSYVKLGGDFLFAFQAMETAKVHTKASNKNTYVFMYEAFPSLHIFPVPASANKPTHVDEMTTLLGYDKEEGFASWAAPYSDDPPAEWEIEFSKAHIKSWVNFARTGNPNGPTDVKYFTNTEWPTYDMKSEYYLLMDREMSAKSVGQRLLAREEHFWMTVLPEVIKAVKDGGAKQKTVGGEYCERDDEGGCKP